MGGSEHILVDLAARLEHLDPVVACPEGALADALRENGVRVFPLRRRRLELRATLRDRVEKPLRLAGQAAEVHELTTALRPSVLVGWGTRAAVECAATIRRLDPAPALVFQNNDLLQGPVIERIARLAARRADLVVSLSAAIARDLDPDGQLEDRGVVVPPGVQLDRYEHAPVPDGPPNALLLGALVGWKRPRLALEAVARAARELPDLTLTVAGPVIDEPGERLAESLRRRAEEPDLAGRVRFVGALDDPRPALTDASCLLHCADCEPFGMVLVEALASGRPVVAPAACGPAEVVPPDCGRLFVPGDANAAADALVGLLGTPGLAARVGAEGRRRAERLYSVEESTRRWSELVEEAVSRRSGAAASRHGAAASAGAADHAPPAGTGMALVTVLHDSERAVAALLHSVERHLPGARVVAIDSGSSDGGPAAVRRLAPDATVVELDRTVGFGPACNAAMDAIEEPVTVLVNPDVELLDPSLEELAGEVLRDDRPERVLAPLVVRPVGRREDSAHNEPGSPAELARAVVPTGALPRPFRTALEPWRSDAPRRVGWAVGCCLVARTETLRRLGPFDDRAFMYAEDLDLGLRATDAGIETWFWPTARVLHHRAHASARVFGGEPYELLAARRREVVRRWRGPRRQTVDDSLQLATFANRMAIKALLGRASARERRQALALLRARRD
ncbi:MAG: N-acetylglucosaminyl-diphospho-decaprenol L-rhamnosyltransferase [Thermoleophilaceae bacterium]|nr:N-acetylglucosaminyl-diphospho-decaprenol L-rhamnosyltransferase [Thermoleophilaceae bacterium]